MAWYYVKVIRDILLRGELKLVLHEENKERFIMASCCDIDEGDHWCRWPEDPTLRYYSRLLVSVPSL